MAPIEIPDIYRKFRLLIEYSHASGWDAIADHFGAAVGTVKGWGQGNDAQLRDRLPPRHLDKFVDLIARALPETFDADRIREIVFGPALLLEQVLRARSPAELEQLLNDEADRGRIRLVRKPDRPGLIERESSAPERPVHLVPLGAAFRLECDAPFPVRHVVALQQAQRLWGFVPAEINPGQRRILLPGFGDDGAPDYMSEREQAGLHRFIVLQTRDAVPVAIEASDRPEFALDYAALAGILGFYRGQPAAARHLYLIELMIGAADDDD
ncbi:hypothetical protein HNR00_003407 [Methylorubrum rhodinum]|uniref:Uncharacterized protein n=1 Tax=Methylorubrum rhodinum TaxID=29428 RepID=A0A840ZND1_9HYPH|nr:hypothetical protein [Methylorubrum rhodinum]MBB5758684.1 hypothetical protein [Methylorubrum rhodinum]